MENRSEILNELSAVAPALSPVGNANPYSVPLFYFEGLAGSVLQKINTSAAPVTSGAFYHVPEHYFEGLASSILQKIQSSAANEVVAELEQVAPLLNSISKAGPFAVPEGYFDQFQVAVNQPARVITMPARAKWLRYASAAAVAGIVLAGGYFWAGRSSNNTPGTTAAVKMDVQKEVAAIPDEEIMSYLSLQPTAAESAALLEESPTQEPDVTEYIKHADTKEIQQFLDENPAPGASIVKGI